MNEQDVCFCNSNRLFAGCSLVSFEFSKVVDLGYERTGITSKLTKFLSHSCERLHVTLYPELIVFKKYYLNESI